MSNDSKTERQSNIEILRIVAMLMIVMFHIVNNCMRQQIINPSVNELVDGTLFHEPVFYRRLLIPETIMTFGKTGDCIFMLITGYFLGGGGKINIVKSVKKIFGQMLFASIVLVMGCNLYYHVHHEKLVYMHTINLFNEAWWYAGYYLGVIIIAGIVLKKYVISKKTHLTIMAILFAFGSNAWLGGILTPQSTDLRIMIIGLFLFATGAYIRKYNPFERISWLMFLLVMLLTYIFVWISHYNINMWNIQNYSHYGLTNRFDQTLNAYFDYSIVPIVLSLCMFELAIRMHIRVNRIINFFSGASFMVFLLHSTDFGTWIMREKDWQYSLYYSAFDFCKSIFIWSFVIYSIGVVAYALYKVILIILGKYVGKYVDSTI